MGREKKYKIKKIKILIASMLSAIVLVFAAVFGGDVNAEGEPGFPYVAKNDTRTSELVKNTIIATDSKLTIVNVDGKL